MKEEIIGGTCGGLLSAIGTASQTNETLQTISLAITILGGVITIITTLIVPIIKWYKKSKEDGKIDDEEMKEGKNLFIKLIEGIKNFINKIRKKGD